MSKKDTIWQLIRSIVEKDRDRWEIKVSWTIGRNIGQKGYKTVKQKYWTYESQVETP